MSDSAPEAGQSPPDPFGPMHADSIALLARLRAHRAAGGTWMETLVLLGAFFLAIFAANTEEGSEGTG